MSDFDSSVDEGDLAVAPGTPEVKEPSMYQIVLLDNDYTPIEFVVAVIISVFGFSHDRAIKLAGDVHVNGRSVCGIFTKDIAETKSDKVNSLAQANEFPVLTDVEIVK